jgi:hypothetical protein
MAAWAVLSGTPVAAQDTAPSIKYFSPGGIFVWADGAYHSINLPTFGLGFFELGFPSFQRIGPVQTYQPRVTGAGFSGGIGFTLPHGTLPGTDARVALVGSLIKASAAQSALTTSAFNTPQLLNGIIWFPCGPCVLPSRLSTDHSSWRVGLNATTRIPAGSIAMIPSIEILGGQTETRQTYAQVRQATGVANVYYDSATNVRWRDVGAKIGLAASIPVTPTIELEIGGTITAVHRHATLSGNDRLDDGFGVILTSAIDVSQSTAAFIPGMHAQITARPWSKVQLRAFGGAEHDNRVPGIASPTFTTDQFIALFGTTTPATPASIGFSAQTNYRVGGGVTVALAP